MKKLISIILCLAMIFAMAATAFAATATAPDVTLNDPITVSIPITKVVEQTGFKAPGAETFKFEVYDFRYQGEVTVISDTIETNGVGTYEDYIVIKVETIDVISEGFLIKEVKGTKDGWTYSEAVYEVIPVFENNNFVGFEFEIIENGDPVTYDEAVFTNSYFGLFNFAPMNPSTSKPGENPGIKDLLPEEPEETEDKNPNTGAPALGIIAVVTAAGCVSFINKRK